MDWAAIGSGLWATAGDTVPGAPFYFGIELNVTRVAGFAVYAIATLACGLRGRTAGGLRGVKWVLVAAGFALLAIDLMLGWRHGLAGLLSEVFTQWGLREARRPIQVAVLGGLAVLGAGGLLVMNLLIFRHTGVGFRLAATGLSGAVGMVLVEVLSLHQVDAVLYARVWGDLMGIALVWIACAAAAVVGAVMGCGRTAA